MPNQLREIARRCHVGKFNAELAFAASRRTAEEGAEFDALMQTAEFGERAAKVESHVRTMITRCQPVPLPAIAAELEVPIDLAYGWLRSLGVPIDGVSIAGRAAA